MVYGYIRIKADRRAIAKFCKKNKIAVNKWTSKLPAALRQGDVIICSELPRFGNMLAIASVLKVCLEKGVQVWSVGDGWRLIPSRGSCAKCQGLLFPFLSLCNKYYTCGTYPVEFSSFRLYV